MVGRATEIAKASLKVMRSSPALIVPPLIAAAASVVFVLLATGVMIVNGAEFESTDPTRLPLSYYLVLAGVLLITSFVAFYCNAAVTAVADAVLRGYSPPISYGFRVANSRIARLVEWALISALVGTTLKILRDRLGFVGALLDLIGSIVWAMAMFFVLPVLILEDVGVRRAMKRSIEIIRRSWGEAIIFEVGIGLITLAFWVPALAVAAVVGIYANVIAGVAIGIGSLIVLVGAMSALESVFKVALYEYSVNGWIPAPFTIEQMYSAAKAKSGKGIFSGRKSMLDLGYLHWSQMSYGQSPTGAWPNQQVAGTGVAYGSGYPQQYPAQPHGEAYPHQIPDQPAGPRYVQQHPDQTHGQAPTTPPNPWGGTE